MFPSKLVVGLCLIGILSHLAFVGGEPEFADEKCADGPPEGAWSLASYITGPGPDAVEVLTGRHVLLLTRETDTAYTGTGVGILVAPYPYADLSPGFHFSYTFLGGYDKDTCVLSGAVTMWDIQVQDVVWWAYRRGRLTGPLINTAAGNFSHVPGRHELDYLG